MLYKKTRGVTLTEILIVLVILGILTAIALPQYTRSVESGLGREAKSNLKGIATAEKIYRMKEGSYYIDADITNITTQLKINLTESNWDYSVTGDASTFTAHAERQGAGGYLDCQYNLTHNDADGKPDASSACP